MQAPTLNRITQGAHGATKAVDHSKRWRPYWVPSVDPYVYAPEDGTIDSYQQRGSGTSNAGNALRLKGRSGLHQFAHLERSYVKVGQKVKRGQRLAKMGHTGYTIPSGELGAHLHYWLKTSKGYVYPPTRYNEKFIKYAPSEYKMPPVGSKIVLDKVTRTTFKKGTTTVAGYIRNPKNWVYTIRGYDSKYPNRVIINTASGGGNGVALALYYTSGAKIEGWKRT